MIFMKKMSFTFDLNIHHHQQPGKESHGASFGGARRAPRGRGFKLGGLVAQLANP